MNSPKIVFQTGHLNKHYEVHVEGEYYIRVQGDKKCQVYTKKENGKITYHSQARAAEQLDEKGQQALRALGLTHVFGVHQPIDLCVTKDRSNQDLNLPYQPPRGVLK